MSDRTVLGALRTIGDTAAFAIRWDEFVADVVAAMVWAGAALAASGVVDASWSEDQTTLSLGDYLEDRLDQRYSFQPQYHELTDEIRRGDAPITSARRPDLAVAARAFAPHRTGRVFRWEAKLVRRDDDCGEYVRNGMVRHLDGRYSRQVCDGGMLAYVHGFPPSLLAERANHLIATGTVVASDGILVRLPQVELAVHRYKSDHNRESAGPIVLHHLHLDLGGGGRV